MVVQLKLGLVFMACVLAACGAPATPVTIELDVFSGRPNPSWTAEEQEAAVVLQKLNAATPAGVVSAGETGLGYRGFLIKTSDATYRVYRRMVLEIDGEGDVAAAHADVAALESELAAMARRRGYAPLIPADLR